MAGKVGRRSRLHDFRDADGDIISYSILIAVTGLTQGALQNRLRVYDAPPTDLRAFVKNTLNFRIQREFEAAVSGAEHVSELEPAKDTKGTKAQLDELEIKIKEQKLRELQFKNERAEGKYVLLGDVQLSLDNFLIALRTNLEALPEQVAQAMMTCRTEHEAIQIMLEALQHLTREWSDNPIAVGDSDASTTQD